MVKPAPCKTSASVVSASGSRYAPLSRTVWLGGSLPVIKEACAGFVRGAGVIASTNPAPSRSKASIRGVPGPGAPV